MQQMKQQISLQIDALQNQILQIAKTILQNPELGYKEYATSQFVQDIFKQYDIPYTTNHAVTGVKGILKGKQSKYTLCIMGELDAVKCHGHTHCNLDTGAAHACGHNMQVAMMLGVAIALKQSDIMQNLDGDIVFMAVPAEEFIELKYRQELKNRNQIQFFGGKQQLIYEGAFDNIDMAIMLHAQANAPENKLYVGGNSLGFIAKSIQFIGKEAHASTPTKAINALNAAIVALSAINANRETFEESDKVRVHPIITNGGDIVNTVPADVRIETYVRASNFEAINKVNNVVDNCMQAGALAIGAGVNVQNQGAYLPLHQSEKLSNLFAENASMLMPKEDIIYGVDMIGSTDVGDLSHIIPCIQPTIGGCTGNAHSKEFTTIDEQFNIVTATKMLAYTAIDLLANKAEKAQQVVEEFTPNFTKEEYLQFLNNI